MFKVGDKVKLIRSTCTTYGFQVGKAYRITKMMQNGRMQISNDAYCGYVGEEDIEKVQFTKSDLKDGDIVTYKDNHKAVVGTNKSKLHGINEQTMMYLVDYDENLNYKTGGHKGSINDIIKVERPIQYETVFERKDEILDEAEKKWLSNFIKSTKIKVKYIIKMKYIEVNGTGGENEYLVIYYMNYYSKNNVLSLPIFKRNTKYKGMKLYQEYTLEELGL